MTDETLDRRLAESAAVTDEQLAGPALSAALSELSEAIVNENVPTPLSTDRRRRRWFVAATAAAALVVAAVIGAAVIGDDPPDSAWADELVEFAEASPLLLLDEPGWEVTRADEYGDQGEMTFSDGERSVDLHWRTDPFEDWVEDRAASADLAIDTTVLGQPARLFRYAGSDDHTVLWLDGDRTLELRGRAGSVEAFEALAAALRRVDVDTWLGAMPASVVAPVDRPTAVREMLADVPMPPGVTVADLEAGEGVADRYQLGAEVTGPVVCGWVDEWQAATDAGDTTRADAALAALDGARDWAILVEMSTSGDWPEVIWGLPAMMRGDDPVPGGRPGLTVDEFVGPALGCQHG